MLVGFHFRQAVTAAPIRASKSPIMPLAFECLPGHHELSHLTQVLIPPEQKRDKGCYGELSSHKSLVPKKNRS